jgi:hypothetical protein
MMQRRPDVQRLTQLRASMNTSSRVTDLAELHASMDRSTDVVQRFGEFGEEDKTFEEFVLHENDLAKILKEIEKEADDEDRQAFFKNDTLKAAVRVKHGTQGLTAIIGKLLVGGLEHQNPAVTQGSENFFQGWLAGGEESIADREEGVDFDEQTMNCWESVLYTAIQAGVVPKDRIAGMYATAKQQGNAGQLMTAVYAYLRGGQGASQTIDVSSHLSGIQEFTEVLKWVVVKPGQYNFMNLSSKNKAKITEEAKRLVEQGQPSAGQLVIYEKRAAGQAVGPTHVALCLGGKRIMTLNGKGNAVEEHEIGDWQKVFPEDKENDLIMSLFEDGWQVQIIDPPWL